MRFSPLLICIIFLFKSTFLVAQTSDEVRLSGIIKSKETSEPLPRASIGIIGTQHGTIANKDGRFSIALDKGKSYKLRIKAIGYKPDTISINLTSSEERTITLSIEPITAKEIIVSSDGSRIEARRIMHEVINRKKEWQSKLNDYKCNAYSRWNLRSLRGGDTTVQSVLESTADCFWKKEKGFSEIITSRRQTANFPAEMNAFSVGFILNFYDNRIEVNDISLIGPAADDAFGSYDYDLTGTSILNGASVYQISVEPDLLTQGFEGTLWIDQTDYTIAYLDLSPSKSVKLGPLKDIHLQQTFELFENNFYLPVDLRTNVSIKLQLPFIPQFKFELLSVLHNYSVNKGVDDSLFGTERHRVAPLADSVDTAQWSARRFVPLAADEEKAYHRIDSTVAVAKNDSSGSFSIFDILSFIDIPRYNHVEGWRFGLSKRITPVLSFPFTIGAAAAYGLDDKQWKYELNLRQGILWATQKDVQVSGDLSGGFTSRIVEEPVVLLSLEGKYFDDLTILGTAYSSIENTLSSLIYKKDYQTFYHEKGYSLSLDLTLGSGNTSSLFYKNTELWDCGTLHNVNLDTINAKHRLSAVAFYSTQEFTLGDIPFKGFGRFETSSKQIGSDYSYSTAQFELSTKKRLGGLGVSELTGRYATLLTGEMPPWNTFFFETRNGFFSKPSFFRGLDPIEFQGNRMWSLNLEHNFYDLPTRLLGIHFLDFLDLHWLLHAGIGAADVVGTQSYSVINTENKPYCEIGFGIGNIYNILRLEGTWRLTHKKESNFYPTLNIHFSF